MNRTDSWPCLSKSDLAIVSVRDLGSLFVCASTNQSTCRIYVETCRNCRFNTPVFRRQARHCFSSLEHIFAGKIVRERARWSWRNSQKGLVRSEPTLLRAGAVYAVSAASYFSHPLINPLAGLKVRPEGSAGSTLHTQRS